jgi:hypothetical protein
MTAMKVLRMLLVVALALVGLSVTASPARAYRPSVLVPPA